MILPAFRRCLLCAMFLVLLPLHSAVAAQPVNARADELVLKLRPGTTLTATGYASGNQAAAINTLLRSSGASLAQAIGTHTQTYRVAFAPGSNITTIAQQLHRLDAVASAEPNYTRVLMRTPNDPILGQQWALRYIHAFEAWDITTGGDITIAILDTGVSASHPDLSGRVLRGRNLITGTDNASDDEGHGTYVAGVAAARGDNKVGVAGLCWSCKILPVKVLGRRGEGDDATIAEGIRYAVDQGVRIISMSLGGPEDTQVLRDAVAYAHDHNVLVIAASGNGQANGNEPNYPAAYPTVMAVSAVGGGDVVTGFSTTGDFVDIAAPGVGVWSTMWSPDGGNTYGAENGTSAACPHVAGAAALALTLRPDLSADQLKALLEASADDIGPAGKDPQYGAGRLNLLRTVQMASDPNLSLPPAPAPAPAPGATPAPAPTASADQARFFAPVAQPNDGSAFFPETGHTLRGVFRAYWQQNGGLPVFGFPISEEFTERGDNGLDYTVQYFERHRFELHQENAAPYNVLLGRIGDTALQQSGRNWFAFPRGTAQPGCKFFPETGHNLCEPFLSAWRQYGLEFDGRAGKSEAESLALFGQPLSEPQTEILSDGQPYTVQWFERARFEDHNGQVLFGLLSDELVRARGWR